MLIDESGTGTTISDEELELDLNPNGSEDYDTLVQKLKNAEMAKKQILARAKKAEAERNALKEKPTEVIKETPQPPADDSKLWEVVEMAQQGYTKEDVAFILRNGGMDALKDPNSMVSIALKSVQEQRRAENAASQTSQGSGMSEIERKYTPEQLQNMTAAELAKILPHAD